MTTCFLCDHSFEERDIKYVGVLQLPYCKECRRLDAFKCENCDGWFDNKVLDEISEGKFCPSCASSIVEDRPRANIMAALR